MSVAKTNMNPLVPIILCVAVALAAFFFGYVIDKKTSPQPLHDTAVLPLANTLPKVASVQQKSYKNESAGTGQKDDEIQRLEKLVKEQQDEIDRLEILTSEHTDDSLRPRERPERPKTTELKLRLNAIAEWDEFYSEARANRLFLPYMDFQEMVINRVVEEVGVDVKRAKVLIYLIEAEQMDVADGALERFGDWWSMKNRINGGDKTIGKEVREIRREIREDYESLYSKVFAEDEMEVIDRHLRNTNMLYHSAAGKFVVCGVGEGSYSPE